MRNLLALLISLALACVGGLGVWDFLLYINPSAPNFAEGIGIFVAAFSLFGLLAIYTLHDGRRN